MTRPILPPTHEMPEVPEVGESTASALHALYHEGATAEPSLSLDRSILDAARAELRNNGATQAKRQTPWWKGWLPATTAIAAVVVGLSVTWRVMDEQERHLREEMRAAQTEGERADKAASAQRPAEAQPSLGTQTPVVEKRARAESAVIKDAPIGVPQPEAKSAPAGIAAPAAPAAMAPMLAEEAMKKTRRAEKDEPRERSDASAAMDSAASPARALGKLEAGGFAADAATPEAWLKQIRELRAAGRSAEAAQSLARFRARYPDFVLPDDLQNLK